MERDILQHFYETYSREVYLYLFGLCHDRFLAEDLMQETFVKALLSLNDTTGNVRAWLYTVARNLCFNEARHRKQETLLADSDEEEPDQNTDRNPEIHYLRNEQERMLFNLLQKLDPRKREILLLQYYSGLTQKEISRLTGLTPENVRVLAHRAKLELRQEAKR